MIAGSFQFSASAMYHGSQEHRSVVVFEDRLMFFYTLVI